MMRRLSMTVALCSSLAGGAFAQTDTPTEEPDIAAMLEQVEATATALNERVSGLEGQIAGSANSEEEGAAIMDSMLEAARAVVAAVNSESPLWEDVNDLMAIWRANRDRLVERGASNPALIPLADEWQAKIDEAMALRTQLIDQAAEGAALVEQIEQQRELILELYQLRMADRVLTELRTMSEELGEMNTTMAAIRDTARNALAEPGAAVVD